MHIIWLHIRNGDIAGVLGTTVVGGPKRRPPPGSEARRRMCLLDALALWFGRVDAARRVQVAIR
jgi:hypothetical protein